MLQSLGAIQLAWLSDCADGGHLEVDLSGDAGRPQRVGALVAQTLKGAVKPLDLTQPPLGRGACFPLFQVGPTAAASPLRPGHRVIGVNVPLTSAGSPARCAR